MGLDINRDGMDRPETRTGYVQATNITDGVYAMTQKIFENEGPLIKLNESFRSQVKIGRLSQNEVRPFSFGYLEGFQYAVREILAGKLKIQMLDVEHKGEESNGNT